MLLALLRWSDRARWALPHKSMLADLPSKRDFDKISNPRYHAPLSCNHQDKDVNYLEVPILLLAFQGGVDTFLTTGSSLNTTSSVDFVSFLSKKPRPHTRPTQIEV